MSLAWIQLVTAGILEIIWAITMKYSDGFTKPAPSAVTLFAMILSFWLLAQATRTLPIGTAYAAWVGIGATGAALLGMILLHEPASLTRILCLLLIIGGVIGLKIQG
jgi:quaternary ammonium compound-resistance protein SugE